MLSKLKKNNHEGFTIIEVLIVLAIAGLILLIVFLAVPALQRNATNTNIKNDASSIAAAVSEYENNNSGALPAVISADSGVSGTYFLCGAGDTSGCTASGITDSPAQFKVGQYSAAGMGKSGANGDFSFQTEGTSLGTTYDQLFIESGATCSGNAVVTTGASSESIAIAYNIESGNGYSNQCITAS